MGTYILSSHAGASSAWLARESASSFASTALTHRFHPKSQRAGHLSVVSHVSNSVIPIPAPAFPPSLQKIPPAAGGSNERYWEVSGRMRSTLCGPTKSRTANNKPWLRNPSLYQDQRASKRQSASKPPPPLCCGGEETRSADPEWHRADRSQEAA